MNRHGFFSHVGKSLLILLCFAWCALKFSKLKSFRNLKIFMYNLVSLIIWSYQEVIPFLIFILLFVLWWGDILISMMLENSVLLSIYKIPQCIIIKLCKKGLKYQIFSRRSSLSMSKSRKVTDLPAYFKF